jgi:hypothetical protein
MIFIAHNVHHLKLSCFDALALPLAGGQEPEIPYDVILTVSLHSSLQAILKTSVIHFT